MKRISNPPSSYNLMHTSRSFGNYDLAASLADIIDNSITARATNIDISILYEDSELVVRIRDNGTGMSEEELIRAMRPASSDPQASRENEDLGRFGWGLKSASLSQCRVLSVVSWRRGNDMHAAQWDIDDIDDWGMSIFSSKESKELLGDLGGLPQSGTEIIWRKCDRLLEKQQVDADQLFGMISEAGDQLELTFHRYLEGGAGQDIAININGRRLESRDPFLISHPSTQTQVEDIIPFSGTSIKIKVYVLPQFGKLSVQEQSRVGGREGMIRNQGFYIYRNARLIISGTWFKLVQHGSLWDLTRIQVDLPNSDDDLWRINVDKSDAQLPSALRDHLTNVIRQFQKRSVAVKRKKGVVLTQGAFSVWQKVVKAGEISYRINRKYPLIDNYLNSIDAEKKSIEFLFKLIETSFPTDGFLKDGINSRQSDLNQQISQANQYEDFILETLRYYFDEVKLERERSSVEEFLEYLFKMEPFRSHRTFTESIVRESWATTFDEGRD